jgi:hypothetical protein
MIVFSLLMRSIYAVFAMATYMQIFTVMLGRFNRELTKPYIYLVPEPPLKRLLWSLAELLPSSFVEALVIFVPVGLILDLGFFDILLCVLARLSFAFLFTAGNIVVERLWGGVTSRMLVVLLYFAAASLLAAPGIVLAVWLTGVLGESVAVLLLALTAANIPASLLALFLCRNMLEYAELNQV